MDPSCIFSEWRRLCAAGLNNRAAAAALALTEAELLATACGGLATRLVPDTHAFLAAAQSLGRAKYVVRNDHAVLERAGSIEALRPAPGGAIEARSSSFTLRLSGSPAGSAFALEEPCATGTKRSLQLFDRAGTTLVKIVLRDESAAEAFAAAVASLRHGGRADEAPAPGQRGPAPGPRGTGAEPVRPDALAAFLRRAAESSVALRLRVSNAGAALETVTPIRRVKRSSRAPWINVLDPELDVHLYEARIRSLVAGDAAAHGADDRRWLHWCADEASVALSAEVPRALADWVLATNGLREPVVPD